VEPFLLWLSGIAFSLQVKSARCTAFMRL